MGGPLDQVLRLLVEPESETFRLNRVLMKKRRPMVAPGWISIPVKNRLICEMTLRSGQIVWDWNARGADDYRKLDPTYGIRPGIDRILPPK